jgi:hypothetical protein
VKFDLSIRLSMERAWQVYALRSYPNLSALTDGNVVAVANGADINHAKVVSGKVFLLFTLVPVLRWVYLAITIFPSGRRFVFTVSVRHR